MSTLLLQGDLQVNDLLYPLGESSELELFYYDDIAIADLPVGQTVTITSDAPQFSPYLELLRADTLEEIPLPGQGRSQRTFTVEPGIDYGVRVTSRTQEAVGAYTLTTTAGDLIPVPPYTTDALTQKGQKRWQPQRPPGQPITLTYSFMEALPSYYQRNRRGEWEAFSGEGLVSDFKPMTPVQRQAVRQALSAWERVSGITFRAVPDSRAVQLRFGTAADASEETLGWAYTPDVGAPVSGDTWLNHEHPTNRNPVPGSIGFSTLLHEMGHALGLAHPFDERATLPQSQQTVQYTVMAYDPHPYLPERYQPAAPMLYDIAAIQALYGKNARTGRGNTVYRWRSGEIFIATIYDAGGMDTVNARNQTQRVIINLGEGQFSSIGGVRPLRENVAIAAGVTLEHAIGGAGNDRLIGNPADNRLHGSAGADRLTGLAGHDRLVGGPGGDTFVWTSPQDGLDTIADFAPAQDRIDVTGLLRSVNDTGTNPFLEGLLTASIQGANTILAFDGDGFVGAAPAVPFVILEQFTDLPGLTTAIQGVA